MANFNRVILVGNLTRDIELRYLQSGTAVADGTVAVNEKYKSGDKHVENTSFINLTFWGKQAELTAEYTNKGSSVLIEGRLKQDNWETAEGEKRSKLGVVVEKVQFLSSIKKTTDTPQPQTNDVVAAEVEPETPVVEKSNEEVPF